MFRPEAPSEETEQHVESVTREPEHWSQGDPLPAGADDRARTTGTTGVTGRCPQARRGPVARLRGRRGDHRKVVP